MLANIVIASLIWIDLVSQVTFFCGVAMIIVAHAKDNFYHDGFLMDMFVLLVVKVFECMH